MAARKGPLKDNNALTFRIGTTQYRLLAGQGRDFLSCKTPEGGWAIMDDNATAAVAARLAETVKRLNPEG